MKTVLTPPRPNDLVQAAFVAFNKDPSLITDHRDYDQTSIYIYRIVGFWSRYQEVIARVILDKPDLVFECFEEDIPALKPLFAEIANKMPARPPQIITWPKRILK